jgi:serine/threonine-protein kinase
MIGKTVSHFEITAKLGEGGMGEVYRATDSRLGREVAVKVLPEAFTSDANRLARFEREARLLASFNHPNISAIHQLEEAAGHRLLVLELVEGEDLAARLGRGPLGLRQAMELAVQIARGLEAAHSRGIIHRDLKPANVMITADGTVKMLDFGLAKALEIGGPGADDSLEPVTLTMDATRAGVLLGTCAYMSPEQAKGLPVDKRTDIFAFGCVLFEMLTGRRAFPADSVSETLAAVLKEEVEWGALPPDLPGSLRSLLRRCLRKDPDRRLHDVADARIELEELLDPAAEELTESPVTTPAQKRSGGFLPWVVAAIAAAVALAALLGPFRDSSNSASAPVTRLLVQTEPLVTTDRVPALAISPDGGHIVYSARTAGGRQLHLRRLDSLEASPIAGTERALGPFLSPDGERVGFFADGHLQTVAVKGGPPNSIQQISVFLGGAWGVDDSIVYGEWPTRLLWQIPAGGGSREALTHPFSDLSYYIQTAPSFIPGPAIAFNTFHAFTAPGGPILRLVSIESREQVALDLAGSHVRYLPTGHLLFAREGSLLVVPFDADELALRGVPVAVLDGVLTNPMGTAQYDVSDSGTLIYLPGEKLSAEHRMVWVDRDGSSEPVSEELRAYWGPRVSPNGEQIATWIASDPSHVWAHHVSRGGLTRVTSQGSNFWSAWTPDSQRLTFSARNQSGILDLGWQLADRSASLELLVVTEDEMGKQPLSWTGDGQHLLYQQQFHPETGFDLWTFSMAEGEPRKLVATAANELQGILSPDGRWLAYASDESGRYEVYVKPFPTADRTILISTLGGMEPLWAPDGRELLYRTADHVMAVDVETEPDFTASRPRVLFQDRFVPGTPYGRNWDVDPTNGRLVMIESSTAGSEATEIVVVQNWFEELMRLAPTEP